MSVFLGKKMECVNLKRCLRYLCQFTVVNIVTGMMQILLLVSDARNCIWLRTSHVFDYIKIT